MDDVDEMGTKVELYVYDLTKGAATVMSQILIGIKLSLEFKIFVWLKKKKNNKNKQGRHQASRVKVLKVFTDSRVTSGKTFFFFLLKYCRVTITHVLTQ